MFMGLTIANIGGVPAATWLGQSVGWRLAFAATSLLGLLAMAALWLALPAGERGRMPDVRAELRVLTRPVVLLAMTTTVLSAGAMFALYTYIAPFLHERNGASPDFITAMLVLVGIGFSIGNTVAGRLADRSLHGTLIGVLAVLALSLLLLPTLALSHIGAALGILIWAAAAFAVVPPVQMRVMRAASEAPGLASAVNVGAFNLGNALGAAAGGATIAAGLGNVSVALAGAALATAALLLVVAQTAVARRAATTCSCSDP
jgi:DHA1 family inner membrane transport protein